MCRTVVLLFQSFRVCVYGISFVGMSVALRCGIVSALVCTTHQLCKPTAIYAATDRACVDVRHHWHQLAMMHHQSKVSHHCQRLPMVRLLGTHFPFM